MTETQQNYRIVKVGRGASQPMKYRPCANCNAPISDFRVEVIHNSDASPRTYYCVHCMIRSFMDHQKRQIPWYKKLIHLFSDRN